MFLSIFTKRQRKIALYKLKMNSQTYWKKFKSKDINIYKSPEINNVDLHHVSCLKKNELLERERTGSSTGKNSTEKVKFGIKLINKIKISLSNLVISEIGGTSIVSSTCVTF